MFDELLEKELESWKEDNSGGFTFLTEGNFDAENDLEELKKLLEESEYDELKKTSEESPQHGEDTTTTCWDQ